MIVNTGNADFLLSKDLSLKAKGLLCFLLAYPKDEPIHKTELKNYLKDGQTTINTAFTELMDHGYIIMHKKRVDGLIDYDYDVYDIPRIKRGK